MFERLKKADLPPKGGSYLTMEPIPGFFARRRREIPPAREILERIPTGPALEVHRPSGIGHRSSDSRRSA
jgi:hypothetical protein